MTQNTIGSNTITPYPKLNQQLKNNKLTEIADTVTQAITHNRQQLQNTALQFINTDTICYFANNNEDLLNQQQIQWNPWLTWCHNKLNAKPNTTNNISPITQNPKYYAAAKQQIQQCDNWQFYALYTLITLYDSFILAYAVYCQQLNGKNALKLSLLDPITQAQKYNDEQYWKIQKNQLMPKINAIEKYLLLIHN